jgi:hypothetical protein
MSKIQVQPVKPRDGGLRIGVHAGIAEAQYVTEVLEREPGVTVQIDEPATEEQLDGWLYLVVLGPETDAQVARRAVERLKHDGEIECLPDRP